jgi:hypothetical protein
MDLGLAPGEGVGGLVVVLDEGIDVFPELRDAGEAGRFQGLAAEDREPALNLVEPGGVGWREMEVNVRFKSTTIRIFDPPPQGILRGLSPGSGRRMIDA